MVADGTLFAVQDDCYWVDAGTPATYLDVQLDLIDGRRGVPEVGTHPTAKVHPTAVVEHSVIGAGALVDARAVVVGSAVLAGAHIGADARIEGSIVADGSRVGAGAKLVNLTVVGQNQTVPADALLDAARVPDPDAANAST